MVKQVSENVAVIILAAGQSKRFNGCKLLAKINEITLLERAILLAQTVSTTTFVVTGAWHKAIKNADQNDFTSYSERISNIEFVYNEQWQQGMLTSIASGLKQVIKSRKPYQGIILMLADQIALTDKDLQLLLRKIQQNKLICALADNYLGVPLYIPANKFVSMLNFCETAVDKRKGAKVFLQQNKADLLTQTMPNAIYDIDTTEDLANWIKKLTV